MTYYKISRNFVRKSILKLAITNTSKKRMFILEQINQN
jgi:hypothetical protein